jgi:trimeric autotransporter adhesin
MNLFRLKDGNYTNQKFNGSALLLIALVLACFALPQRVQATDLDGVLPGGNTADGFGVLTSLTTGGYNTGMGWFSLKTVSSGSLNTAFGAATLFANTGDQNTAVGAAALFSNTGGNNAGNQNTATGAGALLSNTTGNVNTANGAFALTSNTTGGGNTAHGSHALQSNTTGDYNTALGYFAGSNLTTGQGNIDIGNHGAAGESSTIRIGSLQTRAFIAGIRARTTGNNDAVPVVIDSLGQLGTISSSRRFKKEIKAMDSASEAILALKPVTFQYKSDNTNRPEFGLIAEQVAEVNPNLVVRDERGEIYTVRYDAVNAMLLNEFLKEHRKVEELEGAVASLAATVKEQAAQIQKVSAQLEVSKPKTKVVLNNP